LDAKERYDEIAERLAAEHGAMPSHAFGMPALKAGGAMFAGLAGEEMTFKLGAGTPEHAEAMALPGAHPFDPSGRDRPFKDWVQVPATHADRWQDLAEQAWRAAQG
jgi:hypothetical protein